eukprot:202325-Pleurochrysis_carterae.AAC.2
MMTCFHPGWKAIWELAETLSCVRRCASKQSEQNARKGTPMSEHACNISTGSNGVSQQEMPRSRKLFAHGIVCKS